MICVFLFIYFRDSIWNVIYFFRERELSPDCSEEDFSLVYLYIKTKWQKYHVFLMDQYSVHCVCFRQIWRTLYDSYIIRVSSFLHSYWIMMFPKINRIRVDDWDFSSINLNSVNLHHTKFLVIFNPDVRLVNTILTGRISTTSIFLLNVFLQRWYYDTLKSTVTIFTESSYKSVRFMILRF